MVYTVDIQRMHSTQHNVLATWSQAHVAGSSCTVRTYACVSNAVSHSVHELHARGPRQLLATDHVDVEVVD